MKDLSVVEPHGIRHAILRAVLQFEPVFHAFYVRPAPVSPGFRPFKTVPLIEAFSWREKFQDTLRAPALARPVAFSHILIPKIAGIEP